MSKTAIIQGTKVNYYFVCKTKLWLFGHFIQMERESDFVSLGRMLHETSYLRERKEEVIDNTISIDFIRRRGRIELHEVKKSRKLEKAHIYQMLYYLYYLKSKGIEAMGYIDYPKLRKRVKIELTGEKEKELMDVIRGIEDIIKMKTPPEPERKNICSSCSYFEFCFSGECE